MTQIQIDVPEHLDRKVSAYKVAAGNATKEETIIEILHHYFQANPEIISELLKKGDLNGTDR